MDRRERLPLLIFTLMLVSVSLVLLLVYRTLGAALTIRGLYALVGLVVASVLYFWTGDDTPEGPEWLSQRAAFTLLVGALAVGVYLISFRGRSLVVVVGVLLVGSLVVTLQILDEHDRSLVFFDTGLLYVFSIGAKYLTTGFYFGTPDVLNKTSQTLRLLEAGGPDVITGTYESFFGLHTVTGATTLVTALPLRVAFNVLGVIVYLLVMFATYRIAMRASGDDKLAQFSVLGLLGVSQLQFYSIQVFPQTVAFGMISLYLVVLLSAVSNPAFRLRYVLASMGLLSGLLIVHHLTFLLFSPVLLLVVADQRGVVATHWGRLVDGDSPRVETRRIGTIALLTLLVPVAYWLFGDTGFLKQLFLWIVLAFAQGGSAGGAGLVVLGDVSTDPIAASTRWLLGPNGVNSALVLAVFVVGGMRIFANRADVELRNPYVLGGLFASVLLLKSPVAFKSFSRLGLVWTPLFALVIGTGLREVVSRGRGRKIPIRALCSLLVVSALVATGPVSTYADFYDTYPRPDSVSDFSSGDVKQLRRTGAFTDEYDVTVTTQHHAGLLLDLGDPESYSRPVMRNGSLRTRPGSFVYRRGMAGSVHPASTVGVYAPRYVVTSGWLNRYVGRQNKVYTTGQVGILDCEDGCVLSEE